MSNITKISFVELCLEGYAELSEIHDYVEKWHNGADDSPLHSFLGMSFEEYSMWVEKPQSLRFILFSKKYGIPIKEDSEQIFDMPLAARASDSKEINEVMRWLKKTGEMQ